MFEILANGIQYLQTVPPGIIWKIITEKKNNMLSRADNVHLTYMYNT